MRFVVGIGAAVGFILVVFATDEGAATSWSYDGDNGPHFWHELFPQACSGKHQSPIDIRPAGTRYDPSLNDFAIWYDPPRPGSTLIVSNNGHTVQVVTKGEFYVANGGLPYVYRTKQFHFHWGHAKHHGSEHLIDNRAFPLELHIVSYNSDLYSDLSQAVTEKQGLAILAVLFEMSDEDNQDLEPIIRAMQEIRNPEARKKVEIEAMSLRKLLPRDSSQYYRYNGSLTTPGCFESVVWTIFAHPRSISHRQMHKFRQLLQPRHAHHGAKTGLRSRRSASVTSYHHGVRFLSRRQQRRERRAVSVLDELALSRNEMKRLRRELMQEKEQAEVVTAHLDEDNAGKIYHHMLEAVHQTHTRRVVVDDKASAHNASEYIQENLVNNFRSVQPLNDRHVYRSFKDVPEMIPGGAHAHFFQSGSEAGHGENSENARLQDSTSAASDIRVGVYGLLFVMRCLVSVLA